MRLDNKVALVTGAASGIGKKIAVLFAREGGRVTIADLNQKGAEAVANALGRNNRAIGEFAFQPPAGVKTIELGPEVAPGTEGSK